MTKPDLGMPSEIQDLTYQQNREKKLKQELLLLRSQLKDMRSKNEEIKKELS